MTQAELKSPFDEQTLQYFRQLLKEKRKDAEFELELLKDSITETKEAEAGDFSSLDDGGTGPAQEQMNYNLLERSRIYIQQLDDALERIENGTYGICQATGLPISQDRLEAVPHTRYSREAKDRGLAEDV